MEMLDNTAQITTIFTQINGKQLDSGRKHDDTLDSKHSKGAKDRKELFNLKDLQHLPKKNYDDFELIQEPTWISNPIEAPSEQEIGFFKRNQDQLKLHFDEHRDHGKELYSESQSFSKYNTPVVNLKSHVNNNDILIEGLNKHEDGLMDCAISCANEQNSTPKRTVNRTNTRIGNLTVNSQRFKEASGTLYFENSYKQRKMSGTLRNFLYRMKISQITRKFIAKVRFFSQLYKFKQLTKRHYEIISDKASHFMDHKGNNSSNKKNHQFIESVNHLMVLIYTMLNYIQPIQPESTLSIMWDIVYGLVLLAYLFFVPVQLSFGIMFPLFQNIVFFVFLANFIFTFNKCYYDKGQLISNRMSIIQNFLQKQFFIDILVFVSIQFNAFQFIGFLKFFDVNQIVKRADNHFQIIRKSSIAFTLINLIVIMTLIAQIAGCAFHYVAKIEIENNSHSNWIHAQSMEASPWQDKYIISIYFAFITMMTVGFGDVIPVNNTERIYVIFMTLLSSGIFGYVVNTIGQLYLQSAQKQEQFQKRKQEITIYMDERNIDSHSKLKVAALSKFRIRERGEQNERQIEMEEDIFYNIQEKCEQLLKLY